MYTTRRVIVQSDHVLHSYFDETTKAANNLYNATLFRIRQVMTAVKKEPKQRTANENEIMREIESSLPAMNEIKMKTHSKKQGKAEHSQPKLFVMPTQEKWMLSQYFLDALLKVTNNPDYCDERLSKQVAQKVIRSACGDMLSFFRATKAFRKNPAAFTGKPKLPHYRKKGGSCTVIFTNQDCVVKEAQQHACLKFPLTDATLDLGTLDASQGRLKQVTVTPYHGVMHVQAVFDDEALPPSACSEPKRICAIDFGVNNIAAISNNIGKECLLFKGGVVKSANQWYNKRIADIMSKQTKGTTQKFCQTAEGDALLIRRNNIIRDFLHKVSKSIVEWCIENEIDTIIAGTNKFWKQNINIGRKNNQEFVQIPFDMLRGFLKYRAERVGIQYVEQEESYTSQASFLDGDFIPVYGDPNADKVSFSGKRKPTRYKGMHKAGGFRGLYATADGTIINSDLNGAANIGRKFTAAFADGQSPNFNDCIIVVHPDLALRKALRARQRTNARAFSKSKQRRMKQRESHVTPLG